MEANAATRRATSAAPPSPETRSRTAPLRWFSPMPVALLMDPSIAAESKVLAGLLLHFDGPRGCYPRIDSLTRTMGVSKWTVMRSLEELERYGFLTRERRGRNNIYHLTPAYVPPARPDDIVLTGELAIENAAPKRPVKRVTLRKPRPDPELPLSQSVASVPPIPIGSAPSVRGTVASVLPVTGEALATPTNPPIIRQPVARPQLAQVARVLRVDRNTSHPCHLDINKNPSIYNQQQQEAAAENMTPTKADAELALINAGVAPDDAVRWAADVLGFPIVDVIDALRIMRSKPAFLRREIARPGAYLRVLCTKAVPLERELAEHDARSSRSAEIRRAEAAREASFSSTVIAEHASTELPAPPRRLDVAPIPAPPEDNTPTIQSRFDALDDSARAAIGARAQHFARAGPESAAWPAALSMAAKFLGLEI